MDEDLDFDDVVDESDSSVDYETHIGRQRQDVRRKIEELLERKRLREEFGDLDDF
ncbi:MAG: PA3496 family putative envelope integrity protein [Pseudomonadota bacterium]